MYERYPRLIIEKFAIRNNTKQIVSWCDKAGIFVVGVIKGATGIPEVASEMVNGGVKMLASSRLEQLDRCKKRGIKIPMMMLRVPMLSEIPKMIEICDYSLNSEMTTINEINREVLSKCKEKHGIVLMADLGDLREGFINKEEIIDAAIKIEKKLDGVELKGIGTNLGCYGSVIPTEDKMKELKLLSEKIEESIGRKLEIVSGGATSSLMGVFDGYMDGINMLRIGAAIITGPYEDLNIIYGRKELDALQSPFTLEAEIIEIKKKPSYPIGKLGVDAFGKKGEYIDQGIRLRALIAVGRADYGDISSLIPTDENIKIIGASGDHTILDIEDSKNNYNIGDIIKFELKYSAILNLSSSENVARIYK